MTITKTATPDKLTIDANEAAARVAYRVSELVTIYPITPSSPMAEHCDEWAVSGRPNIWGNIPEVSQMQSEAGVAGALHGALQAGSLATTFTASQGLLLMLPNMFKIAGELTPFCMHVTARSLATHALSIFGDHSDVMACRSSGFAMLASSSVQEAQDLAAIAHAATLKCRVPFVHFFDGFRTSHEINTITPIHDEVLRAMMDDEAILAHHERALTPDHPQIRGTAQNPDVFFQAREAANPFYANAPAAVEDCMRLFEKLTGRAYRLFEYEGPPDAEKLLVIMGSGAETARETSRYLNEQGEKTGVLTVRLYRPFCLQAFCEAIPPTVRRIAVLDRTKEPGALGEPLYQDVCTAVREGKHEGLLKLPPRSPGIIGGRYGLGSKEFSPAMVKAVFDELDRPEPKTHFTVGIADDVSGLSLEVDPLFHLKVEDQFSAVFYGLGSDGTVGANKNSIKIIGQNTDYQAQAYFVYDSKKSGGLTTSHLRFGKQSVRAPYLVDHADFVACHQWQFLEKYNVLSLAGPKGIFLLNSPYAAADVWGHLPRRMQEQILEKRLRVYVINANEVARITGMGGRINTIMQTAFFAISGVLERDEAIRRIKDAIRKTYGVKGDAVVQKNCVAVDTTLEFLEELQYPAELTADPPLSPLTEAPDFVQRVTARMLAGEGDLLPVSAFPVDGSWPSGTSRFEKRSIAREIPVWNTDTCTQCNRCVLVCPHAAIRAKFYPEEDLVDPPATFKSTEFRSLEFEDSLFTIQVAPEDCTGCGICVSACPSGHKAAEDAALIMSRMEPLCDAERENFSYFESLPLPDRKELELFPKDTQFRQPLFEFSGACSGCGQTPVVKLLTQLFGDRMMIANATGCSSIYGGNLPTTPYCTDNCGRGPAWANSLFEDNAEFGFGMRLSLDNKKAEATRLLRQMGPQLGADLVEEITGAQVLDDVQVAKQRGRLEKLYQNIRALNGDPKAHRLLALLDYLVDKAVWIIGGDGWAYDIGFGGLDHVIASGRNVNILVLDTQVYSNTGGQQSKATPTGAMAKFAAAGKELPKKDLGQIAMSYGGVYVAQIALGADPNQAVRALCEANSFDGPSLVIAYGPCIAHGIDLSNSLDRQKKAVESGFWPLYRFDPRRSAAGEQPFQLDCMEPGIPLSEFLEGENRFRVVRKTDPDRAAALLKHAQRQVDARYESFEQILES